MHVSSMGVSKLCFLFSLALCALLLLIPTLQPSQHQGDLPRPRAHNKPAWHPGRLVVPLQADMGKVTVGRNGIDGDSMGQSTPRETNRTVDGDWVYTARRADTQGAGKHIDSQTGSDGDFLHRTGGVMGAGGSRPRNPLELKDIFIAVKTTRKYHKSRLDLLFQTWVSKAKEQTFIFTDGEDQELRRRAGDNIINTNCSAAHTRQALCCKMSVEYDKFIESQRKWFCHMDDDNYVIVPSLLKLLSSYHHTQDVYLGRPSLDHPIEAAERVKSDGSVSVKFWFATGGAGFCISRGLALKMSPWASLGNFISTAEKIRLPDDCTMGYIIEALLEVTLTHTHLFHSHLENLQRLPTDTVLEQVTLSYGGFENRRNVISIGGAFSLVEDPSRFKTVHCLLYPETDWCPSLGHH
ncbi:beta-1,3-N-acetylglucosaminyltransferase radical fringe isoform X2 [Oncorhynchus mykiss]|uniref:O-fucosylpeptide 3-beta-N-acetylglucosaminyltransferase n=2 Tax=Oncorhynchus mykiss TaxID=8022 RepID=A0A8K9X582_ONCMY|nr:beta-1,3-N-acetylglucosaminyltransferase radical fringe isoform X2 [Oncorhynchus mykiss]XP_036816629.1 beta-1,3-N-acetylglucosaminyltransferase radical fringe isoform X2 [Oncorhynchus mykiss]